MEWTEGDKPRKLSASSLRRRLPRRVRAALRRARRAVAERPDAAGPGPPWELTQRSAGPAALERGPATDLLYGRLGAEDVAAVEARFTPEEAALARDGSELDRKRVLLALGVHHAIPAVLAKTGLSPAEPPTGVHAMGRGPLAAGGTAYYADLVADGAARGGRELTDGMRALDLGCSSGRVVRVLAAAYPDVEWHGCDPNTGAIEWARRQLGGISFAVSPQEPPLPWPQAHFDLVFAISVWSHFSAPAATRWLAEMRRLLGPGGALLLTTHGYQSVAHARAIGQRSTEQLTEVLAALYRDGHWYKPEFGEHGDHGVASPDWGTAFLTPEWLLAQATPDWRVEHFAPGLVEGDQDLYVLSRR